MGVRGLARAVDVSASLISQIERGRVQPSVATLHAVVTALRLSLDDLFREGESKETVKETPEANVRLQRAKSRQAIRLARGVRWEQLTPRPVPGVEFIYVVYEAGATSCDEDSLIQHGGTEYAYVVSGRVGIRVGFEQYELRAGDSISFDGQLPHRTWTVGNAPAVAIWFVLNRRGDKRFRKGR